MKLQPSQNVRGYTDFCDDVRHEIGGKLTLVGVYGSSMLIHEPFPATLPKLCLSITYFERVNAISGPVQVRIFLPGNRADEPDMELTLPIESMRRDAQIAGHNNKVLERPEEGEPTLIARFPIVISPFEIEEPGNLRVRVVADGKVFRFGSLNIDYEQQQSGS